MVFGTFITTEARSTLRNAVDNLKLGHYSPFRTLDNIATPCSAKTYGSADHHGQILRSQIAISSKKHGGRRYPPYAFTEHGAIMAATVLNSKRAIEMSVFVVRAFVRMREMLIKNRQLAAKINELDRRLETHDTAIQDLIDAIKELMLPEGTSKRKIGFQLPPAK